MKKNKMTLRFLIVLLVVGGIIYYTLHKDYKKIIQLFSNMDWLWFFVTLAIMVLYNLVDVWFVKYTYTRKNPKYTNWMAIKAQQIGSFFNAIDPFGGSGQFAQPVLLVRQGISVKYSTSIIMLTFVSYQTILVILTSFLMLFFHDFDINPGMIAIIFFGFFMNFVVIFILIMASISSRFQKGLVHLVEWIIKKIPFIKNGSEIVSNIDNWLVEFQQEIKDMFQDRELIVYRLISDVIRLLLYFSSTFFVAKALNIDLGLHQFLPMFVLTSFVYIVSSIVPLPGSVGGAEATFLVVFQSILGYSTASVMLLWRFFVAYLPMIFGFIIFASSSEFKQQKN